MTMLNNLVSFVPLANSINYQPLRNHVEKAILAEDVYQLRLSHVDKITSGTMPEDEFEEYKSKLHQLSNKLADSMEADGKITWWQRLINKIGKWTLNAYIKAHKPIKSKGQRKVRHETIYPSFFIVVLFHGLCSWLSRRRLSD